MRTLLAGLAVGAAAVVLALPADAGTLTLKDGTVGGLPWKLTARASSTRAGSTRLPSLCMSFLFAWGRGQSTGNGPTFCVAPARGTTTAGPPWLFDTATTPYNGLGPPGVTRIGHSVRSILFLADPRTSRVVAWLADRERLRIPARPVPGSLRRPAKFALSVTAHAPSSDGAANVVRAVAYDARGNVVGRMSKKAPPLPKYTYP
jgi:hypothetical protein